MELLEKRILTDGRVVGGNILKVDSFLNHQIDVGLLCELGREFHRLLGGCGATKILTIEASGIGIACLTAQYFGVPVVFAKKHRSGNISEDVYTASVDSFTHGCTNNIVVSKEFLNSEDRILIIDDFLATGNALIGLYQLVTAAGAEAVGAGIVIEKSYQNGAKRVQEETGLHVESLAHIASMNEEDGIRFV